MEPLSLSRLNSVHYAARKPATLSSQPERTHAEPTEATRRVQGSAQPGQVRGLLQLPKHTLLLVDECALETGQLQQQGVRNVKALQELLARGQVLYEFACYWHPFPTDVRVVILSEGTSCLQVWLISLCT